MGGKVCVFWDDVEDDGWAKVDRMHHQPDKLDAETSARGIVATHPRAPRVKPGWTIGLYVEPESGAVEWRVKIDREYRMPAVEFLGLLPATARVAARQAVATDPLIADFMAMIDMSVIDSASTGIHPAGRPARDGLGYMVSKGWLSQADMDAIVLP